MLRLRRFFGAALLVVLIAAVLAPAALADAGPKPTRRIVLQRGGKPLQDGASVEARMLACVDPSQPPQNTDPMLPGMDKLDLGCDSCGCTWQIPGFRSWSSFDRGVLTLGGFIPTRFRVAVYLPSENKLWLSDAVTFSGLYGAFTLDLAEDGTGRFTPVTTPALRSWQFTLVLAALALSLLLEVGLVVGYAAWRRRPRKSLITAAVAGNAITLPLVWLLAGAAYLLAGPGAGLVALAVGEGTAVLFEALLYLLMAKEKLGWALLLSLAANVLSYSAGFLLH